MSDKTESNSNENDNNEKLDIDRVDAAEWPEREFPIQDDRRKNSVRVVMKQSVLNDIHEHGLTDTSVEICGVLVGKGYRDERGPYVYIEANIRGENSENHAAQVTFTGETWNHIHNELDSKFPELQILGWYHTHPGFGIFLSGMDLFIHENYFSAEHQLAFVYDPIGGDEGLFVWREGKTHRDGFLIESDVANSREVERAPQTEPLSEPMTAAGDSNSASSRSVMQLVDSQLTDGELSARVVKVERQLQVVMLGMIGAILLAGLLPIAMWFLLIQPQLSAQQVAPSSNKRSEYTAKKLPVENLPADKKPVDNKQPKGKLPVVTEPNHSLDQPEDEPPSPNVSDQPE